MTERASGVLRSIALTETSLCARGGTCVGICPERAWSSGDAFWSQSRLY